jgi:hypothetical protein
MQPLDLIPGRTRGRTLIAVAIACLLANAARAEQGTADTNSVIPLIVMEDVPLSEAIKNLARQGDVNCILDPQVAPTVGPDGRWVPQPLINGRWANVTAKEALIRIMQGRGIYVIEDTNTTIARITRSKRPPRQSGIDLLAGDTKVIPLIVMDDLPLQDAIKNLARDAGLKVQIDPDLSATSGKHSIRREVVSVRWENVSARQALAAVLNNYDLVAVRSGVAGDTTFTIKPFIGAAPAVPEEERSAGK